MSYCICHFPTAKLKTTPTDFCVQVKHIRGPQTNFTFSVVLEKSFRSFEKKTYLGYNNGPIGITNSAMQ
jgi:hypothetical protein